MKRNNATIILEEDPATGELIMPIPDDIWQQMVSEHGWHEGMTVVWEVNEETQTATISMKKPELQHEDHTSRPTT
jgi:hypothetical protein